MKKYFLYTLLILGGILISKNFCYSQNQEIKMHKALGVLEFSQGRYIYKLKDIINVMSTNPEAQKLMKSAKSGRSASNVLGFIGGILVGWSIGDAITSDEPSWTPAIIGGGLILITIPISTGATNKMKKSIDIYNQGISTGYNNQNQFHVNFISQHGKIGLSLTF